MQKLLVITSNDEIKMMDYNDYESTREAVEGGIELLTTIPVAPFVSPTGEVDIWCNEEFTYLSTDSCNKINIMGTLLRNTDEVVYGNIAVTVKMPFGESRGFEYEEIEEDGKMVEAVCESWCVEDWFLRMKTDMEEHLKKQSLTFEKMHEKYDKTSMQEFNKKDVNENIKKGGER